MHWLVGYVVLNAFQLYWKGRKYWNWSFVSLYVFAVISSCELTCHTLALQETETNIKNMEDLQDDYDFKKKDLSCRGEPSHSRTERVCFAYTVEVISHWRCTWNEMTTHWYALHRKRFKNTRRHTKCTGTEMTSQWHWRRWLEADLQNWQIWWLSLISMSEICLPMRLHWKPWGSDTMITHCSALKRRTVHQSGSEEPSGVLVPSGRWVKDH